MTTLNPRRGRPGGDTGEGVLAPIGGATLPR
jgi:hypothetical protein